MLSYSTTDLAHELHTDRNKIDNLRKAGLLRGIKIGKGYIYPEEEVKRFLKENLGADVSNVNEIMKVQEKYERGKYDSFR